MAERWERYEVDSQAYHLEALTRPCFVCGIVARHPDFPAQIVPVAAIQHDMRVNMGILLYGCTLSN